MRDVQALQETGGAARTFQELAEHVRSSQEEYAAKGVDLEGKIYGEIHLKIAKIKP